MNYKLSIFFIYVSLLAANLSGMSAINKVARTTLPDGKTIIFFGDHHNESGGDSFCGYKKSEIGEKQLKILAPFLRGNLCKKDKPYSLLTETRKKIDNELLKRRPENFFTLLKVIYSYSDGLSCVYPFNSKENFDNRDKENSYIIFAAERFDLFLKMCMRCLPCESFNKSKIVKEYSPYKGELSRLISRFNSEHRKETTYGNLWFETTSTRINLAIKKLTSKLPAEDLNKIIKDVEAKTIQMREFLLKSIGTVDCSNLLEKLILAFETNDSFNFLTPEGDIYQLFFYTFAEFSALYVDLNLLNMILDCPNQNIVVGAGYMHCDAVIGYLRAMGVQVKQLDMFNKRIIEDKEYCAQELHKLLNN